MSSLDLYIAENSMRRQVAEARKEADEQAAICKALGRQSHSVLYHIGGRLVGWGSRLQERYQVSNPSIP